MEAAAAPAREDELTRTTTYGAMSQPEQRGGAHVNSSAASASVSQETSTQATINSDDPAWAHYFCPDVKKKRSLQCKYCNKTVNAGITRMKYHLANIGGNNVTKCKKVPADVKAEMAALLSKKIGEKEQKRKEQERVRETIDLDHSDGDEETSDDANEVMVLQPTRVSHSSTSRAVAGDVTIEKFYKASTIEESIQRGSNVSQKVQTKLTTQKREERRDRACEYIRQFFL
ncbi:uncharacterized protein C2845_PM06G28960 [Panicum miliaceum]|uniref:BED-type domain-containing protein n=1 Tax=Panicum miliaceum TaxID=4540 RepID=A0A3L6R6S3_PANMI|nr:uncharacterized protein C2845_PM06G28960 [Panicum miliaceum]